MYKIVIGLHGESYKFVPNFSQEYMKWRDHVGDIGINGRIILECIIVAVKAWTGFVWLAIGPSGGL
jgi:hypothetical protein